MECGYRFTDYKLSKLYLCSCCHHLNSNLNFWFGVHFPALESSFILTSGSQVSHVCVISDHVWSGISNWNIVSGDSSILIKLTSSCLPRWPIQEVFPEPDRPLKKLWLGLNHVQPNRYQKFPWNQQHQSHIIKDFITNVITNNGCGGAVLLC